MIGFSSFGVLVYYAIANAATYTMRRRRVISVCGLVGCLVLVATLPWESAIVGLAVFAVGIAGRATTVRRRR
ncbi:hypothetical protein [Mycobacterium montefiorense]|uniref:hypothetical protein n=1 Tax=Mycobacterium montefiorense TaxID=154654 RepID=UPI0021DBBB36|nr:hypothetical protein [Mycobacterium montefiorense]MCV7428837.1 hypothetical protein [Mycobacterium montefiorense]GLE52799.1 hypothetical protein ATCCBAA256_23600 [Mycobacterium montefiorense]